jgi:hypothetical protein
MTTKAPLPKRTERKELLLFKGELNEIIAAAERAGLHAAAWMRSVSIIAARKSSKELHVNK